MATFRPFLIHSPVGGATGQGDRQFGRAEQPRGANLASQEPGLCKQSLAPPMAGIAWRSPPNTNLLQLDERSLKPDISIASPCCLPHKRHGQASPELAHRSRQEPASSKTTVDKKRGEIGQPERRLSALLIRRDQVGEISVVL